MRSCLILGSGRSGTSMLAGSLASAGYYMGEHLYAPRSSNPKGFFEDREVNDINEALIAQVTPARPSPPLGRLFRSRPASGQRWLSEVPLRSSMPCSAEIGRRIERQAANGPFCFKDPRFCYTLPAWRPHVGDAGFLCVFREPSRTAHSILRECREARYLRSLRMDFAKAVRIWTLMYRHVVDVHRTVGDWLFVHYEQVLDRSAFPRIRDTLGIEPEDGFPDPVLSRSPHVGDVGIEARETYALLCELAGYRPARAATVG